MSIVQASTSSKSAAPSLDRVIPLSAPQVGAREAAYLKACIESGWVSSAGPFVKQFERAFADAVGANRAVAVVNGTAGLHVALHAALVQPDDEVLVPTLTFIAPVNAIRYCQAHPVFVDADPRTWQMDVAQLEAFLKETCEVRDTLPGTRSCWNRRTNRRVRAIVPVHLLGLACEMDRIVELARRYHLVVVEDAAEAVGVTYQRRHVGTWGDLGVFSFNGNKTMTCGGGGMVVAEKGYADYVRYLTTQAKDDPQEYYHKEVGYNYRLTNLQAAVGLAQLEQLPEFLEKKRAIAAQYHEAFAGVPGITPMPRQDGAAYWLYTVLVSDRARRDEVLAQLAQERIEARPLWHPIHTLPPYQHDQQAGAMSVAMDLYERAVSLPSSIGLRPSELKRCSRVVATKGAA